MTLEKLTYSVSRGCVKSLVWEWSIQMVSIEIPAMKKMEHHKIIMTNMIGGNLWCLKKSQTKMNKVIKLQCHTT